MNYKASYKKALKQYGVAGLEQLTGYSRHSLRRMLSGFGEAKRLPGHVRSALRTGGFDGLRAKAESIKQGGPAQEGLTLVERKQMSRIPSGSSFWDTPLRELPGKQSYRVWKGWSAQQRKMARRSVSKIRGNPERMILPDWVDQQIDNPAQLMTQGKGFVKIGTFDNETELNNYLFGGGDYAGVSQEGFESYMAVAYSDKQGIYEVYREMRTK